LLQKKHRIAALEKEYSTQYYTLSKEILSDERYRLGRDLHDGLGNFLTSIKTNLEQLEKKIEGKITDTKTELRKEIHSASSSLGEACKDLRLISHNMMEKKLEKEGLLVMIEEMLDRFKKANKLEIQLIAMGMEQRLEPQVEATIYYLISELVQNAIKHSKGKQLIVQLFNNEDELDIIVEDDGVGFDPKEIKKKGSGAGLHTMPTRVKELGGKMEIDSIIGRGSTFSIHFAAKSFEKTP